MSSLSNPCDANAFDVVAEYCAELVSALSLISIETEGGRKCYNFESAFFPVSLDEGRHAFERIESQTRRSREVAEERQASRESVLVNLSQIMSRLDITSDDAIAASRVEETPEKASNAIDKEWANLADLKASIGISLESTGVKDRKPNPTKATRDLFDESGFDSHALMPPRGHGIPRVVLVASAGHGKTTLLNRIALLYARARSPKLRLNTQADETLRKTYGLRSGPGGGYVPCPIKLRSLSHRNQSTLEDVIQGYVRSVFAESGNDTNEASAAISAWVGSQYNRVLLMLDGLDELPAKEANAVVGLLEEYLGRHPHAPVLLSTRASGIVDPLLQQRLAALGFYSRAILPLCEREAELFANNLIDIDPSFTDDEKLRLKNRLAEATESKRLSFLREFMRSPLELTIVLRQLASGSLAINRYDLYHDMLWELLTSHTPYEKNRAFDDLMSLLSALAYHMQERGILTCSLREIRTVISKLSNTSFHTDILGRFETDDIRRVLDTIASNIGVVERDEVEGDTSYTFPIRSYQEFLAAHACCHLKEGSAKRPDPSSIIRARQGDGMWTNVICFALAQLSPGSSSIDVRGIIDLDNASEELLRTMAAFDIPLSYESVNQVCASRFSSSPLTIENAGLLSDWLETSSAGPSFAYAIDRLHAERSRIGAQDYSDAYAQSALYWSIHRHQNPLDGVRSYLGSTEEAKVKRGASMLAWMLRCRLEEDYSKLGSKERQALADCIVIDKGLLIGLAKAAYTYDSIPAIEAILSVWVSGIRGCANAEKLLNGDLCRKVLSELLTLEQDSMQMIFKDVKGGDILSEPAYERITYLCKILGSFPIEALTQTRGRAGQWLSAVLGMIYERSKKLNTYDQAACAISCLVLGRWSKEDFALLWHQDICNWNPAVNNDRRGRSVWEQRHFALVGSRVDERIGNILREFDGNEPEAGLGFQNHIPQGYETRGGGPHEASPTRKLSHLQNTYDSLRSSFQLFTDGEGILAARSALRQYVRSAGDVDSSNNLAFLLRHLHLDPTSVGSECPSDIAALLARGVRLGEPFSVTNMALLQIERGNLEQSLHLLESIAGSGISTVSENFWAPILWDQMHEDEGAFIGVVARILNTGGTDGLPNEMIAAAMRYSPAFLRHLMARK